MATYKVLEAFQAYEYPPSGSGTSAVSYRKNLLIDCHWATFPGNQTRLVNTINGTNYDVTNGPITQITPPTVIRYTPGLMGAESKPKEGRKSGTVEYNDGQEIQNSNKLNPTNMNFTTQFKLVTSDGDQETFPSGFKKSALKAFYQAKHDIIAAINDEEQEYEYGYATLYVRNVNTETLEETEWKVYADYSVPEPEDDDDDLEDLEDSVSQEKEDDEE